MQPCFPGRGRNQCCHRLAMARYHYTGRLALLYCTKDFEAVRLELRYRDVSSDLLHSDCRFYMVRFE